MKLIYLVEVKEKGKWRVIGRHKCNKSELQDLKMSLAMRIQKDNSSLTTFRIRLDANGGRSE